MKPFGDIAFFVAILGINTYLVFMLWLTKWYRDFLSVAWTIFFFIVAVILDLSAVRLFVPESSNFIVQYIRTPLYLVLAISIWALISASISSAVKGKMKRRLNVDLSPDKK